MGGQPLYDVDIRLDGERFRLGRVGFRDIRVDDSDGGFRFVINGVPQFIGGAVWMPADAVSLSSDRRILEPLLGEVVRGNLTMLRVPGDTVYESDTFYDLCDELGILVWQDCMLAFADPPLDEQWERGFAAEVRQNLSRLASRPSLALVSGGSEIAQQAAYAGVSCGMWDAGGLPLLTERLPVIITEMTGDTPYIPTSPWGGDMPTRPDTGVSHYYGVGAYLRDPDDARRAAPRFAAECLAFANPPKPETVDGAFGSAAPAAHDPAWKRAIYRDAGASWDFEDVRDHYLRKLFGLDSLEVRRSDPDRYLQLGRAVVAVLVRDTFAEWRRRESACAGGLVFYFNDALPGAGMGVVDSAGIPKSPWYAMRRVLAPVAVTVSDEGLNGLVAHLHNATPGDVIGTLTAELFVDGELRVDHAERPVKLQARSSDRIGVDSMFEGFRDLAWAHRFGPLTYDVVVVRLLAADGTVISEWTHQPGGLSRAFERDLGLEVEIDRPHQDSAELEIRSRRYAQFVTIDAPGWLPDDDWFDLAPGQLRRVSIRRGRGDAQLTGAIRPLNGGPVTFRMKS